MVSFVVMTILMVMVIWLNLGTLLLTSLFGYLVLQLFCFGRRKFLSLVIYLIAVAIIGSGLVYFSRLAYLTLPKIAETSIPAVVGFAEKNGIQLPFTDYASMKSLALEEAQEGISIVGRYARAASLQFVLLLAGLVIAVSIFMTPSWVVQNDPEIKQDSWYACVTREIGKRFATLYKSFALVMGAQVVISAINTLLTAVFLACNGYPYSAVLIPLTFLCGLLPIVGNLMSNILIVGVGFTLSPKTAIFALIFLIVIHKLEYFLNSKIIGQRINNPMWLTLIALLLGERLMGIPGMILAPAFLHYVKAEASTIRSLNEADHPASQ